MQKRAKAALGTALAVGAGYLAGVLTAPKSGRETRKDIRKKAQAAKSEAERKLKEAHSELHALISDANTKLKTSKNKATIEVKEAIAKAEAAKTKAKEVLSAIHEGEADDRDLQKAVNDAKRAVTHLKNYLGKKI